MNDRSNKIFLRLYLHIAVTLGTHLVWLLLESLIGGEGSYDSLWICIFVTNCTALILARLNRILQRLPGDEEQK